MTEPNVDIRPARAGDLAAVLALLSQAGLPTTDLAPESFDRFVVAADRASGRDAIVGAVALEVHGAVGLLRSLVVMPAWRGRGVGEALVAAVEARAADAKLERIGLLTETAAPFFVKLGYAPVERNAAPAALRASSQFASVCPVSAAYFEKGLASD